LLLDIPHEPMFDKYIHCQASDMSEYWADMDTRYEHNDKPLTLINNDIEVVNIKRVIGTAYTTIKRKEKIDVSLNLC